MEPADAAAGALFTTPRSALVVMVVRTVGVAPGVGLGGVEMTFAVLLRIVPLGTFDAMCAVSVNIALTPGASGAMLHEMNCPVVQVKVGPVVCDRPTNVVPAGRLSFQETLDAVDGPLFVTVTP